MANFKYDGFLEAVLKGEVNWLGDNIRAVLIDKDMYTPNKATHNFLSNIPDPAILYTSVNLSGKTATKGLAKADPATFINATGPSASAVVLYKHTGNAATSRLIAYYDQASGFPVIPNGADVRVVWPDNGIFQL